MALTKVVTDGIATGAVTSTLIATGAVTASDLEDSGVTAGTYGSSSAIPAITVDAKGRVTSASTSSIDSTAITNGTSNVSVAASGNITATRAGTTRLTVNSTGIDVTGTVGCDGLALADGQQATFGNSNDLVLYHDGANSYIIDQGTGHLNLNGTQLYLNNSANTQSYFSGTDGGAASLYYAGSTKLSTTSTGIDVTGTVKSDALEVLGSTTIKGTAPTLVLQDTDSTGNATQNWIVGRDSAGTQKWYVGDTSAAGSTLLIGSEAGDVRFDTSGYARCSVDSSGHFVPYANNNYDLGTSSYRWRNVYTNDLNLSNEGGANDVDGTWGSWTIQEGEDDLFLLNRRNGKKYKFNLSEVN